GDHPTDVQAARAAGCLAVGVASGRVDAAGLSEAGAQVVLPDAGEIFTILE
ncbi:MAG: HAD hydrolase-like protein, partial [Thermodesulfobacteriota bacterium]